MGQGPRLGVQDPTLVALVVERRGRVDAQEARQGQRLLAGHPPQVVARGLAQVDLRPRRVPSREDLGQALREPHGLRAERAVEQDVRILVVDGLVGVVGSGVEIDGDVVAVGPALEVALHLLGSAVEQGHEGREGAGVVEGDDDRRGVGPLGRPPQDRFHHPAEPLEVGGQGARAVGGDVAEHLEVRGARAGPAVGGGRGGAGAGNDEDEGGDAATHTADQGNPGARGQHSAVARARYSPLFTRPLGVLRRRRAGAAAGLSRGDWCGSAWP